MGETVRRSNEVTKRALVGADFTSVPPLCLGTRSSSQPLVLNCEKEVMKGQSQTAPALCPGSILIPYLIVSLLRCFNLLVPLYRDDWADKEDVGGGAEERDGAGDGEGPEELAGAVEDTADHDRSNDAGQVATEIFEARPPAGSLNTSQNLRHSPKIRRAQAERRAGKDEDGHRDDGIGHQEDHKETDRPDSQTGTAKCLEHNGGTGARGHPTVGTPPGCGDRNCERKKRGTADQGHGSQGKIALANEVER
jgi:hypothetical protein